MPLQYHKLETEKDLNLLAYRPLLVVIAASFGFLWSRLLAAVYMIQMHFTLVVRTVKGDERSRQFCLAGDETDGSYSRLVSPWPGQFLMSNAPYKDSFNYFFLGGNNILLNVFLA